MYINNLYRRLHIFYRKVFILLEVDHIYIYYINLLEYITILDRRCKSQ